MYKNKNKLHIKIKRRKTSFLRICIVTPDLLGPVKNGGIGTACTNLARALAQTGHEVHILFTQTGTPVQQNAPWLRAYQQRGIAIHIAARWAEAAKLPPAAPAYPPLVMAHTVYRWLATHEEERAPFDVVFFMEWQGCGFYALQAKRTTSHFQRTTFVTQIHSPSIWHSVYNADIRNNTDQSLLWYMERESVRLADAVVSPSRYMLEWCAHNGYTIPADAVVLPNLLELDFLQTSSDADPCPARELVFFGRLEYRKGIVQFCDAIDILLQRGIIPSRVTFMGKFAWVGNEHAALYIARRMTNWPMPVDIQPTLDHKQALLYLHEAGRLAVIPSVADNSPYTVYECLKAHIPFVARRTGGIPELLPEQFHAACLCSDTPLSLADRLETALKTGLPCPGLSFDEQELRRRWRTWVKHLAAQTEKRGRTLPPISTPCISVCLTHRNRPKFLKQALDGLLPQAENINTEIILVDDGSTDADALRFLEQLEPLFKTRDWKILRLSQGYPGRARNRAAETATGEWLFFFDDDNVPRPHMLSQLTKAAQRQEADIIVPLMDVFADLEAPGIHTEIQARFLPLAGSIAQASLDNTLGDTAVLIRRSVFQRLGGFSEDYGIGHEDFEFLLKAALSGLRFAVLPEALFWYRQLPQQGISNTTSAPANRARSLRPFLSYASPDMAELALLAHSGIMGNLGVKERIAVAPQALSDKERKAYALRDPNDAATLAAIVQELFATGHSPLASAMLRIARTLPGGEKLQELTYLLATDIMGISQNGKEEDVLQALQSFVQKNDGETVARLFLTIAPRLGKFTNIQHYINLNIARADHLSLSTCLAVSSYLLGIEDSLNGCRFFTQALHDAEQIYLVRRDDVRKALEEGLFTCALQHYCLHGRHDHTPWPEEKDFLHIWKKYGNMLKNCLLLQSVKAFPFLELHFALVESNIQQPNK